MFKNLHELVTKLNDEQSCIDYLAQQRWKDGKAICVYCGHDKCYRIENGKRFKCANKECYKRFHVTVGTIFHASNIPLVKWFMAVYIQTAHRKGISSYQLGKDIGVTQKTAWFMLHRIREGMRAKEHTTFKGTIEADETYMARKYRSDFKGLSPEEVEYKLNHKNDGKGAVLGLVERETKQVKVFAFPNNDRVSITATVYDNVATGSKLHTDETYLYRGLEKDYYRETVVHGRREWSRASISGGKVHTNNVENFWSVMKRGIYGIYHQISYKHLQRYCDEFSYRYNNRDIRDCDRFTLTLTQINSKLPYKLLVHGKGKESNQTKP